MTLDPPLPDAPPLYWRGNDTDPTIVGRSTDAVFVVHGDGTVWLVPDASSTSLFVNSTVERFHRSMRLFVPAWHSLKADEDATAMIDRLTEELRIVDERVFTEDQTFWPPVLEQVADGLL